MREDSLETREIERELDDTRSRLDATIRALQHKLAPATMVDQTVAYFTEGGGVELGRNLGRSMRDNPIPVALIGVGFGWLMLSGARREGRSSSSGWRDRPWMREDRFGGGLDHDMHGRYAASRMRQSGEGSVHQPLPYEAAAYEDLATKAYQAGSRVERQVGEAEDAFHDRVHAARGAVLGIAREAGEAAASFRQRVEQALTAAADSVRSFASEAGDRAGHLADRGQAAARDAYEYGVSTAGEMRQRAGQMAGQARGMGSRTVDYVQDQPLLLGALGVTVGAVLGLMVPSSRHERRIVGAMRENFGETARLAVGEAGERVARVAGTVVDTAQEAARREGFERTDGPGLASATRERVADVASRARHVVEETASAGVDAVRDELSGADERKSNRGPVHKPMSPAGTGVNPRAN